MAAAVQELASAIKAGAGAGAEARVEARVGVRPVAEGVELEARFAKLEEHIN